MKYFLDNKDIQSKHKEIDELLLDKGAIKTNCDFGLLFLKKDKSYFLGIADKKHQTLEKELSLLGAIIIKLKEL